MPTLQSFSAYTPHLNSWVYSNTQGTKGITNLMLSRNLCEFFPLLSLENAFSALELYRLYISLCTLIFYFNPIIGFRICMRAVSISCSGIIVKSIPQNVDISLCSAKYCIPAVRIANCIFSVFGDSDA